MPHSTALTHIILFINICSVLTFTACNKEEGYASVKIKGQVNDILNHPINQLLVTITNKENDKIDQFRIDDTSGKFERIYLFETPQDITYVIEVKDTDGEMNGGKFESQTKILSISTFDYVKQQSQLAIHRIAEKEVFFVLEYKD